MRRLALPFLLAAVVVAAAVAAPAAAQVPNGIPTVPDMLHVPGKDVTVSLLTMGDGAQVWEMFGHSAIRIRNDVDGRDTVFNWGEFDMRAPHFILHFLQGLNWYQMGGQTMSSLVYAYRYWNRSVTEQELDLTDAQKDSLIDIIRVNAEPQNLLYRYDYFVDNCATRPRDILDRVLGGQLRVGADSVTPTSYRYHALRLMQGDMPLVVGVDIGLGEPSDRPITKWQEMFLPEKLHDWVASKQVRDSTGGAGGAMHPLVRHEQVIYQSTRAPEPTAPPKLAPFLTALGIVLGAIFLWLGMRDGLTAAAVVYALWALVCGLLGIILTALWTVTDHRFAHYNENLLLFNPLWLALVVMAPMYLRSGRAARATRGIASVLAGLSVLALLGHAVLLSRQVNLAIIGLALPPAIAIAYVVANRLPERARGELRRPERSEASRAAQSDPSVAVLPQDDVTASA